MKKVLLLKAVNPGTGGASAGPGAAAPVGPGSGTGPCPTFFIRPAIGPSSMFQGGGPGRSMGNGPTGAPYQNNAPGGAIGIGFMGGGTF